MTEMQTIAVIPSGRTQSTAAFDAETMFVVKCVGTESTTYKHNIGIVAIVVGSKPADDKPFIIRHGTGRKSLGEYVIVSMPDVPKLRFWTLVPNVAANAPQRRSQGRTAATAPQSAMRLTPRVLVGTTASLQSQLHI
jgi:hypothetical protein